MAYSADPDKHWRAAGFLAGEPIPDADESTLSNVLIQPLSQQRQLSIAPREGGLGRTRQHLPRVVRELVGGS